MTKYAVIDRHGAATVGLSLREAAEIILWDDGQDYEIRKHPDGLGFALWYRQQVANVPWTKTAIYSAESDDAKAEADIFAKTLAKGQEWGGFSVYTMDQYAAMLAELAKDEAAE